MKLSFKDLKFILEALTNLMNKYERRIKDIEDIEEYEDEVSDLDNDYLFVESLKIEIEKSISEHESVDYNLSPIVTQNLESIIKSASQLSVNERLLLVEAITQSIRKENNLVAS